jgi:hypothetical protein
MFLKNMIAIRSEDVARLFVISQLILLQGTNMIDKDRNVDINNV